MFLNSSKSSKQESITAAHNVCKVAKAILDFFLPTVVTNHQKHTGMIQRSYFKRHLYPSSLIVGLFGLENM